VVTLSPQIIQGTWEPLFSIHKYFLDSIAIVVMRLLVPSTVDRMKLFEKLIIGYANWHQCDDSMIDAVRNGVNVLMWFSIDLGYEDGPVIQRGPDLDCVARIYKKLNDLELDVIHMITIGGWNAPHPKTTCSPEEMYQAWRNWNEATKRNGFPGFAGFDWDIEGNDDLDSPFNEFTKDGLDMMGRMSQLAKQDGLIVSMAPAESYLNCECTEFDRRLSFSYKEWMPIVPEFTYHGKNCYAYLLSKYGTTAVSGEEVLTFDFIMIQFYEGFSRMLYYTKRETVSPAEYMSSVISRYIEGWKVDYSSDPSMNLSPQTVRVHPSQLVIGLANGWANNEKFLFLNEVELAEIAETLRKRKLEPRGYGFWNLADEGNVVEGTPFWLSKILYSLIKPNTLI
jgi:hypothetical protein